MKTENNKQGFTLLELLVVVLIIGILASIALPQYQMAVTKAKVASILPLMRRWKDALAEYKLQHGDYDYDGNMSSLDVSWPSDWKDGDEPCDNLDRCYNDYWDCSANNHDGSFQCGHYPDVGALVIHMFQPDDPDCEVCRDKIMCFADGEEANKVCKALGGKPVEGTPWAFEHSYSL